nr:RecName: Full=Fibrinogen alpha chain; Contains: RecName: Full=Fibrinopeptide A [Oryctolagus cuniculus]prf//650771N fibrinopeptide A [Oryctolagus cuniculus]
VDPGESTFIDEGATGR